MTLRKTETIKTEGLIDRRLRDMMNIPDTVNAVHQARVSLRRNGRGLVMDVSMFREKAGGELTGQTKVITAEFGDNPQDVPDTDTGEVWASVPPASDVLSMAIPRPRNMQTVSDLLDYVDQVNELIAEQFLPLTRT